MNRLSIIALVIILALAMNACSGNKAGDDDEGGLGVIGGGSDTSLENTDDKAVGNAETSLEWPAASLPAGFPKYPDGDIIDTAIEAVGVWVMIDNTSKASYDDFIGMLEAAGYVFEQTDTDSDDASNGDFYVTLNFVEGLATIYVFEDVGMGQQSWPADKLPAGFPVYPNGDVMYDVFDDGSIFIFINNSDEKTAEAYKATLKSAGWEFDELGFNAYKDDLHVSVTWLESGTVSIYVGVYHKTEWIKGWPTDMPVKVVAYPDGDIKNSGGDPSGWGIYIIIDNTSKASYEKYLDMLIADGWKLSGARDPQKNELEKDGAKVKVTLAKGDETVLVDVFYK
jgi:hypothetical protein